MIRSIFLALLVLLVSVHAKRGGARGGATRGGGGNQRRGHGRNGGGNEPPVAAVAQANEKHRGGGGNRGRNGNQNRMGGGNMSGGGGSRSRDNHDDCYTVRIKVTNLALGQPLSEFYVHAHNESSIPLYELAEPASAPFAVLATDGNARDLVEFYHENSKGVFKDSIRIEGGSEPVAFGESLTFRVEISEEYPYISFASMAVNTNDAFIGVAGMKVLPGSRMTVFVPAYDAGVELNNEMCDYIPGPACQEDNIMESKRSKRSETTEEGEGVVYISPGISGVDENGTTTDLNPALYDWRNPISKVEVMADLMDEEEHL